MKIFKKHIKCGVYEFDVGIDRNIAIEAMEEYPELSEYVFKEARRGLQEKRSKDFDELDFMIESIKSKKMSQFFRQEELLESCVKFAFPKMLKKAGSDLDADKIIEYIYENGVDAEFNSGIFELILMGFIQREAKEKKVSFSMK